MINCFLQRLMIFKQEEQSFYISKTLSARISRLLKNKDVLVIRLINNRSRRMIKKIICKPNLSLYNFEKIDENKIMFSNLGEAGFIMKLVIDQNKALLVDLNTAKELKRFDTTKIRYFEKGEDKKRKSLYYIGNKNSHFLAERDFFKKFESLVLELVNQSIFLFPICFKKEIYHISIRRSAGIWLIDKFGKPLGVGMTFLRINEKSLVKVFEEFLVISNFNSCLFRIEIENLVEGIMNSNSQKTAKKRFHSKKLNFDWD